MNLVLLFAGLCLGALAACSREPAPAPDASTPDTSSLRNVSPTEALDRFDQRAPVPLLPMMAQHQKQNMRDHLVAVHEIVAAVGAEDFAAVEAAARRLGSSDSMQRTCTHMGAGAPGFAEQALAFHRTADRIALAALDQAPARVLTELAATLAACTSCHAAWKQQVVDEATWQRLTGSAAPP
ncbi:MAG TPA: hypothetical protein VFU02_22320 [Polyangiaceae bacterium]|nr:hypothetical protein [Polyangiaceae bacterium]